MAKVAIVVGAGDAIGASIARAFSAEGLTVALARRPRHSDKLSALASEINAAGGNAHAIPTDARDGEAVAALFERAEELGELELVVHNIGGNVKRTIEETSPEVFKKVWELVGLSAFHVGRQAAERMAPRGRGTLIFTGATASLRGSAGFSAFSSAMQAKRALAQALACELGPRGVHVAHVAIDGPVETPFVRQLLGEQAYAEASKREALLQPDRIAEQYVHLHKQHRTAWTHEIDLRPWSEPPWFGARL